MGKYEEENRSSDVAIYNTFCALIEGRVNIFYFLPKPKSFQFKVYQCTIRELLFCKPGSYYFMELDLLGNKRFNSILVDNPHPLRNYLLYGR